MILSFIFLYQKTFFFKNIPSVFCCVFFLKICSSLLFGINVMNQGEDLDPFFMIHVFF